MNIYIDDLKFQNDITELYKTFDLESDLYLSGYSGEIQNGLNQENNSTYTINIYKDSDNSVTGQLYKNGEKDHVIHEMIYDESDIKSAYKRAFFNLFKVIDKNTNHPWGILTGIRPVKIVHELLKDSRDSSFIKDHLINRYLISNDKTDLIIQIALLQNQFMENIRKSISVYISIPFCPSRCSYCSFYSCDVNKSANLVEDYLDSLEKEIDDFFKNDFSRNQRVLSIYIGGGTPSSIDNSQILRLLKIIRDNIPMDDLVEYTFEAGRPDTLTYEKLLTIKNSEVTRLSINPQTMNDKTLMKIKRSHDSKDIQKCFSIAREIGFDDINMDIILGLEDETIDDLKYTLDKIYELMPDSLTVHTLSVKRASQLKRDIEEKSKDLNINDISKFISKANEYALKMDMKPYYLYRQKNMLLNLENIGYAKKDKISVYNIGIMEEKQSIIAFGSGAVSKFIYPEENRLERVSNIKDVKLYTERIDDVISKKMKEVRRWI